MKGIIKINGVRVSSGNVNLEYAQRDKKGGGASTEAGVDREKLKALLIPLVKEAVKKQLKEEREYYRSRPSQAVKQFEGVLPGEYLGKLAAPAVTRQVYAQLEERLRREWMRKGG